MLASSPASAETRTLKLHFTHTGERATITFKRNGRYDRDGLRKISRLVRDHRRNESIDMDPQLFDIVWEAYQEAGARDYIYVVSGYRSPATNSMLRRTRGGQATKSKHMTGQAMDFFIPGVSSQKLREIGFRLQGGGVGYYPRSASPYVHFDTGNVRAWPRMSRRELSRLFPNGGTAHLPSDGRPLPGYEQAVAAYQARKARGQATVNRGSITRGGGNRDRGNDSERGSQTLVAALFGNRNRENDDSGNASETRSAQRPATRQQSAPPETPATLLAALPSSRMPVPGAAPRANRSGGVPVAITPQQPAAAPAPAPEPAPAPVEAVPAPVEQPAPEPPVAVASLPDFEPPIPSARPAVLIARVEPDETVPGRRSAAEIEAALAEPTAVASAAAIETVEQTSAQREAIVAALQDRGTELAYALPIPRAAPERSTGQTAPVATATLAPPAPRPNTEVAALTPPAAAEEEANKASRLPVPAERAARELLSDPEVVASLAEEQVFTAPKAARPTQDDLLTTAATEPATAVPAPVEAALFTDRMTAPEMMTQTASVEARPDFMMNAQRMAPETVYTRGFQRQVPAPDSSRFTGNAVTFLAVARFEGGTAGGDGQPLQIQVPVTN